jgi:hypothetical protein
MVLREFIENIFEFFMELVVYIINFIDRWGMNIENDDITPATS